jgi:hypothetical protein
MFYKLIKFIQTIGQNKEENTFKQIEKGMLFSKRETVPFPFPILETNVLLHQLTVIKKTYRYRLQTELQVIFLELQTLH